MIHESCVMSHMDESCDMCGGCQTAGLQACVNETCGIYYIWMSHVTYG